VAAEPQSGPGLAVLVSGLDEPGLRRFLSGALKPHLHMQKTQWRARYRDRFPLVVLATPLRAGQDPEALYGRHRGVSVLICATLAPGVPGSGFAAARDWLKGAGFDPVGWVELEDPAGQENVTMAQACEIVDFISLRRRWHLDEIDDLDAYLEQNNKPLW
jgi:hypothetical protein